MLYISLSKYYLANIDYRSYFTLQVTGIIRLYRSESVGFAQSGAELRLGFMGAGKIGNSFYPFSLETTIRSLI